MNVEISDRIAEFLGPEAADKVRLWAAVKAYEVEELSTGSAAELAGISIAEFLFALGRFKISVFNQTPEELEREIEVAARAAGHEPPPRKR
jgi:predicted HTH domain antitoxin